MQQSNFPMIWFNNVTYTSVKIQNCGIPSVVEDSYYSKKCSKTYLVNVRMLHCQHRSLSKTNFYFCALRK